MSNRVADRLDPDGIGGKKENIWAVVAKWKVDASPFDGHIHFVI